MSLMVLVMDVFLSFDFDADSAENLYYSNQPVKISRVQFALNKGLVRILSLLREFNLRATFFVPGWVAENYSHLVDLIVHDKHELALHGYMHEKLNELSFDEELIVHDKALSILRRFQSRIYGFRRPYWELSSHTLEILSNRNIIYDSSLMNDDEPYLMKIADRVIVELPVYDMYDDWLLFEIDRRSPMEVFSIWRYELDAALDEELSYFCLILHPSCIGRSSRIRMLREFIIYGLKNKCAFRRGLIIAEKYLKKKT